MLTFSEAETGILPVNDFISQVSLDLLNSIRSGEKLIVGRRSTGSNGVERYRYYNIPAAFDIETSSFYDGEVKMATMYHWQFGIGSHVTAGRTWESFISFINLISFIFGIEGSGTPKLIVYVHNLPYEFQWMRKWFEWESVFIMDDRKPVYARTTSGIEFRCSLKLSGKSLANTAKDLTMFSVSKLVGDLDYNLIRHSETPLTEAELKYCENDIRVILAYIQEKIINDGGIDKIPLTNTGYVRRYCRERTFRGEEEADDEFDERADVDPSGVSRTERRVSRGVYPRERAQDRESLEESGVLRLYQLLSSYFGVRKIPYEQGRIYRRSISWYDP